MNFQYLITGSSTLLPALTKLQGNVMAGALDGMTQTVQKGEAIVKGKQGGRPGPRAITGDFRRRTRGQAQVNGGLVQGQIGNDAPQALRLEFGFFGTDRLGRTYSQPPYPSFGPAEPEVQAIAVPTITAAIQRRL